MDQPALDHKDWTWVLERACPECGFDAASLDRVDLGPLIRANAARWRTLLGRTSLVAERPPVPDGEPPVWSGLEYGCHVRDVYRVMGERLRLLLSKKNPTFANWDQNRTAVEEAYGNQDPAQVAYDLASAAGKVADMVDRVRDKQWERSGSRSDGATFTVDALVRYLLHDVTHHVVDVERGYEALTVGDDEPEGAGDDDAHRDGDAGGDEIGRRS